MIREDTVSTADVAKTLFVPDKKTYNRRRTRSAEPGGAVRRQFERVYDVVASEAIILCDSQGRHLRGVGSKQLCRMLAQTAPLIYRGEASKDVHLRAMDIIRPDIDWSHLAIRPIRIPNRQKNLFVASVSESNFNQAGVQHATVGVRRILGLPNTTSAQPEIHSINSSRDRLAFDVSRCIKVGFHEVRQSPLYNDLKMPRWWRSLKGSYFQVLDAMLYRVDERLHREGLIVERPKKGRAFTRGQPHFEGHKIHRIQLPVRLVSNGKRWGTIELEIGVLEHEFAIVGPPEASLFLR